MESDEECEEVWCEEEPGATSKENKSQGEAELVISVGDTMEISRPLVSIVSSEEVSNIATAQVLSVIEPVYSLDKEMEDQNLRLGKAKVYDSDVDPCSLSSQSTGLERTVVKNSQRVHSRPQKLSL